MGLTLRVLRGHEGLDKRVGGLRVEREGVAQRRQLGAALQKRLLQPVASGMEVLLDGKRNITEAATPPLSSWNQPLWCPAPRP